MRGKRQAYARAGKLALPPPPTTTHTHTHHTTTTTLARLLQPVQRPQAHRAAQQAARRWRQAGRRQRGAARLQHLALGVRLRGVLHRIGLLRHPDLKYLGGGEWAKWLSAGGVSEGGWLKEGTGGGERVEENRCKEMGEQGL